MIHIFLKHRAYLTLAVGFFILTSVWAFETTETRYNFVDAISILTLTTIALLTVFLLCRSFSTLIHGKNKKESNVKLSLRFFVIIETAIFLVISYLINSATLFIMPVCFLVIMLYPALKFAPILRHYLFGLCIAIIPVYTWAAIWGKFNSISDEFSYLPFILGFIAMLWASAIKIRHTDPTKNLKISKDAYFQHNFENPNLLINMNISIILGMLFFITVINGHTPVLWTGLTISLILLLIMSSSLQKSADMYGHAYFDNLSVLAIAAFVINQVFDVVIDVFFLPN